MATLEAIRPAPGVPAGTTARTAETASGSPSTPALRALSPPPPSPISPPFARSQQRHMNLVLPPVPDHEPDDTASPLMGSTLYDRRQQAQQQSRNIRKLRLPPGRMVNSGIGSSSSNLGSSSKSGVSVRAQTLSTTTPASLSFNGARLADDDEVEEVLEELDDEPQQDQSEQNGPFDINASCLAVQNAALAALRSCIYSMLSLSAPEGNTDSSNPVATVQILNQILQSTYTFASGPTSSSQLSALTRQLNHVAAQQPLLASSDDLSISHALINLLAALQAARDAPPPPPSGNSDSHSRSRSTEDRSSSSTHGHQREADSPTSCQSSTLSPPVSTATSTAGSEQATDTRTGVDSGPSTFARPGSITTMASSPAASEELRDPFAETKYQDEFSILLRRLQALSALVPDSVPTPKASNGPETDSESPFQTPVVQQRPFAQTKRATTAADPWMRLKTLVTEVHDLTAAKKQSSAHQALPSTGSGLVNSQSMHGHGHSSAAGKNHSRSRSASRHGSFSSTNSVGHVLDAGTLLAGHLANSHDGLFAFTAPGDVRSSSSSGRMSVRSSSFSTGGPFAEAPNWLSGPSATTSIGSRPVIERRNSLSSSTDLSSGGTAPPKYSMDSLVDPYMCGPESQVDLRKRQLPIYSGNTTYASASEEKMVLGFQSQESLQSVTGTSSQEPGSYQVRDRMKKSLAGELDAVEDGLERLFAAGPQLSNQRAEPRPRRKSAASDSFTIQDDSKDLPASALGRSTGKGKMSSLGRAEGRLTRQVTLNDVFDKLSRPELDRMEDQRAAPPTASMFASKRSVSVDHRLQNPQKASLLSPTHTRSLSQRLADVVSFKRPTLTQRRTPPSPLVLSGASYSATAKSSPLTAPGHDKSKLFQDPVYISGAQTVSKGQKERATSMDLRTAIDAMTRASRRSFDDQRASLKVRVGTSSKKPDPAKTPWLGVEQPDVDLFDKLVQSSTRSRFSDQEAEFRSPKSASVKVGPARHQTHASVASIWTSMPGSAPLEGTFPSKTNERSAPGGEPLSERSRSDGPSKTSSDRPSSNAWALNHRVTHSVPSAVPRPNRDERSEAGVSSEMSSATAHVKPASLAAAAAFWGWEQVQDPSASPREVVQPTEGVGQVPSVRDNIPSGALDDERDFQQGLSEATSPTGSRVPTVMEQAASSGWTVSPRVNVA
ncbi:unnamed protein product [Tilletia laevis]|uniref:Uncharacterized protein n=2 Tax=Tilletia TaxID=13289 RepID=A0A177VBW2_9BASI|nr:hypothetical protein CF336_g3388 [Tilletia laevis]KAE8262028.1 hypothetical protein A4X03_0g2775 [Tilletia caries]KAE8204754.1 hypothetical protein CF335_g2543 [Tilletia laevis]CAD6892382.1 unnamed protein product [Tilletia caries]CAD6900776.1 unnamed protein product [Tilletia caries]